MARNAKKALEELAHRGPHEVLHGDLALVGMPGVVCTPRSGRGLPAVAFGHGWLQSPRRYGSLLRHLASWGIVAAAPGTQRGPLASHRLFAADLRTALDICVGVRLGEGGISVDADRLAVAGHAMGGGSAVLAAAEDSRVRAVGTFAVTETAPSAVAAASGVTVPGLHLTGGNDLLAPAVANAQPIAATWGGPVQLRELKKASHLGYTDGRHWSELLLHGKSEWGTRRLSRALLTAFLLRTLTGDKRGDVLLDNDVSGTAIDQVRSRTSGTRAGAA
ncbi:MAG: alpha/beta hydrolase [Saccharopolyspora sp.]|uniref:dienelactone hydrolase family protein n=1 Tax=Saccharopolyspora TaxID=1835 RepID=UPI00190B11D9|nr:MULTISPECIES: alpha/beta hydrolase [unclassified Saccharopolyspora]MBK0865788.1 alpha/beta hydrolase [Saccharopolyspora sp. HNM0986]MBQ6640154.1 alpha/beta hydrolase [Saccharopolyspora sp.]